MFLLYAILLQVIIFGFCSPDVCPFGKFGKDCSKNCSTTCHPQPHGQIHCHITTGSCYEGCLIGYYGVTCNISCSQNCVRKTCNQFTGQCTHSCENGKCGPHCDKNCTQLQNISKPQDTDLTSDEPSSGLDFLHISLIAALITVVDISCIIITFLVITHGSKSLTRKQKTETMKYRSMILMGLMLSTLACKNCFNKDCDDNWVCNQGCVAGFFGRECNEKCPPNCIDSICQRDEFGRGVCIIGCSPGFYGMTCRTPCLSINTDNKCDRHTGKPPACDGSKHGSHCELSCSCSGKACDNEGTCLRSCRIGLFGVQCDQQCLPNCPICYQQSGDCIVCKDGFYGDECQHKCPSAISPSQSSKYKIVPGCSVSERNVLDVTLECKNCFNEDCNTFGVCNQGCVAGFFGRECSDKCPTNCIDSICDLDENGRGVCTIGCLPGFYGITCRTPCRSTNTDNKCDRHTGKPPVCDGSKHGSHCKLSCNCSGKACDNRGTCLGSCRIGLFGEQCDQQCLPNCPMCYQQSGDCIVCKDGFYGDKCQHKCASASSPSQRSKYKSVPGCSVSNSSVEAPGVTAVVGITVITLSGIIVFLLMVTICIYFIIKRKYWQRKGDSLIDNVFRKNTEEIQMSQNDDKHDGAGYCESGQ